MPEYDASSWEDALIADIREHDGRPSGGPLAGHPLLVAYAKGAKTGEPRRAILTYSTQGGAYVVAGTASGSPRDPAWLANFRAHPDIEVEIGRERFPATASVADEAERQPLWDEHVSQLPWFAKYLEQIERSIPMVRITRKG